MSNKINKKTKNEKKVVIEEPNNNTNNHQQPKLDDLNNDNLSFCSDDTAELLSDANEYFIEDEIMVESERLILTEPKFHKTLKPPTCPITLKRIIENLNAVTDSVTKSRPPPANNDQIDLADNKNAGFSIKII